jgi:hypothetical protein
MMLFAWSSPLLLLAAFVISLLVTLSTPVIQSIYFFKLYFHEGVPQGSTYKFGIWGYCASNFPLR